MVDSRITLFVTDGNLFEYDAYGSVIRYTDLSRAEALELAERSLLEGYAVCALLEADDCGGEVEDG